MHFLHSNISNLYTLCVCIVHCLIRFIVLTPLQMGLWPYWIKFPYFRIPYSLSLSLCVSVSLSPSLFLSLTLSLSLSVSISLSPSLGLSPSLCSVCVSLTLFLCLSVCPCLSVSLSLPTPTPRTPHPPSFHSPFRPSWISFYNFCISSVQFKTVIMRSEKSLCALPRLSNVFPTLPLKLSQCSCDWQWPSFVLSRNIV